LSFFSDPDVNNNAVAVQNRWVMRMSIALMVMSLVVGLVAILVYRRCTTSQNPQDRLNISKILAINAAIFVVTFMIQLIFFVFFSSKFIPIKPSLQLRTFKQRLNERLDDGLRNKAETRATLQITSPEADEGLLGTERMLGNGAITIGILAVLVLVVWGAARDRSFSKISTLEIAAVGSLFVAAVIVGVYFWIQRSVIPESVDKISDEMAKYVANKVLVPESPDLAETVRSQANRVLEDTIQMIEEQDTSDDTNRRLVKSMVVAGVVFVAGMLLVIIVLRLIGIRRARRLNRPVVSWGSFALSLLLVGLVAAITTILVEFGFANNIMGNYVVVNPGKIVNNTVSNLKISVDKHLEWYMERKCPVQLRKSCPESLNQMRYTGDADFQWSNPVPETMGEVEKCTFEKVCDLCCENGPYSERINLPAGIDQDALNAGDVSEPMDCVRVGNQVHPACPPGNWDEARQVCTQDWDVRKRCSTWTNSENDIWRRHV
jgi:hypothetical protein